jgi:hypothetical protein
MEDLLKNDFTAHYSLPVPTITNFILETDSIYFEVEDSPVRELIIHTNRNMGMAKFSNRNSLKITVANYDKFLTSLPSTFQHGKQRCEIPLSIQQTGQMV